MDKIKRFFKYDFFILILDIITVNASYFLALVLRFSINGKMDPMIDKYIDTVVYFAPFYTFICILVFFIFRLYGGMWRYANISDVNKILLSNVVTTVVHVVATIFFFQRMPISYYIMGSAMQLVAIGFIRFAYRLTILEKRQQSAIHAVNTLVVGTNDNGNLTVKLLNKGIKYRPVAIIGYDNADAGKLVNGIPVYVKEAFESIVVKEKIKAVIFADVSSDLEFKDSIKRYCRENRIQFDDYSSFFNYKGDVDSYANVISNQKGLDSNNSRSVPFSPPDISDAEINEVIETMKSGWITTGPRVKLLERRLAAYIKTGRTNFDTERTIEKWNNRVVCLNSATAAEELNLRVLGIGEGDEVIVPAYTYSASASAVVHCGATVKFVDIQKNGDSITHIPEIDYDALEAAITNKTKAIIIVDIAGVICDYERVFDIVERKKDLFIPKESDGKLLGDLSSRIQHSIGRIAVVSDGAHSLGANRVFRGEMKFCGSIADFTSFSFHAVKNFTTAEGGAATWTEKNGIDNAEIYNMYQLLSLHGQNKDALAKTKVGAWEYDIVGPWFKCNMTDISAAIGLRQLDRYFTLLNRRIEIIEKYDETCDRLGISHLVHHTNDMNSSNHLYMIRIPNISIEERNEFIIKMAEHGVSTNVHYKPLPMMTAYKELGFDIKDYPNAYDYYHNLITLPLHTLLTDDDVEYVCETLKVVYEEMKE